MLSASTSVSGFMGFLEIFCFLIGASLFFVGMFPYGFFFQQQLNLATETFAIFFIALSLALIILSAYLIFKFERRSGMIVYRRQTWKFAGKKAR